MKKGNFAVIGIRFSSMGDAIRYLQSYYNLQDFFSQRPRHLGLANPIRMGFNKICFKEIDKCIKM